MNKQNLRVSKNKGEITSIFQQYIKLNEAVLIWKKIDGAASNTDKKVILKGSFLELIERNKLLVLDYQSTDQSKVHIKIEDLLYVKGIHHDILFKFKVFKKLEDKIILEIPKEIHIKENRIFPRTNYGYSFSGKVEFFIGQKQSLNKIYYKLNIADISQSGIGVGLSSGVHLWTAGDIVQITNINGFELGRIVSAKICYLRSTMSRGNSYRMGIKLDDILTIPELDSIQAKPLTL